MNGTLGIIITRDNIEEINIGREIYSDEWEELFKNLLKVPTVKRRDKESYNNYINRQQESFQKNLKDKGYEMLGRIWFIYQDVIYLPSEINKLLEECLELYQTAEGRLALSALENLIFACNEAIKLKGGILLSSD